jgi:hypothetical protein
MMSKINKDDEREQRISLEIVVDANGEEECAMGWYYYLDDKLSFPFKARCIEARRISPLKIGEEMQVVGMAPEDECMHEMFVEVSWLKRTLAVPLAQLEPIGVEDDTRQAIEDWHYWVARGYQF